MKRVRAVRPFIVVLVIALVSALAIAAVEPKSHAGGTKSLEARAARPGSERAIGYRITKLQPFGGFSAETAGAITLFTASSLGVPVSTTHTITGAIVGVGAVRRLSAVRWGVAGRIVWAWILTIPASALIAALTYELLALAGLR